MEFRRLGRSGLRFLVVLLVPAGGRIFAVAFLRSSHTHVLFGLDLASGRVAVRASVDPPNPTVQQQRGALLATDRRVYVPYGGLDGDCGPASE